MAGCRFVRCALMLMLSVLSVGSAQAEDIVGVPNLSYRTGPFATTGVPLMNGQRDYMTMINERDGGINGVRLGYEECETGQSVEKGIECYEKTRATGIITQPGSPGIALRLLPRSNADRIPMLAPGYGFSPIAEGRVFRWAFNPPATQWDGVSMILQNISGGNQSDLRGRKIALLYLETTYGTEPVSLLQSLADRYGFTFLPIPVTAKEMQNQTVQWRQITEEDPDFVLLWGWGTMNAAALAEAVKAKFPMDRLVGMWWSASDDELRNVGEAAKGYRLLTWNLPITGSPTMQDIQKYVLDPKRAEIGDGEFNSILYQRGVLTSMFIVEAIRIAQEHFNAKIVNAEQLRWGLENLTLDEERLAQIGAEGMVAPFSTSCSDHSGDAGAWMLEWDGSRFVQASELLQAERSAIDALMDSAAREFAESNQPWPMNDECNP